MKSIRFFRAIIAAFALSFAALFIWRQFYPSETLRYRMTVLVDTPSGSVNGSSVIETTITEQPKILPSASYIDYDLKGEAVTVKLRNGQFLFALLAPGNGGDPTGYHASLIQNAVRHDPPLLARIGTDIANDWRLIRPEARKRELQVDLTRQDFPMLVTFDDIDDPTSVKRVDPDDLASVFGEGVSLLRIRLQVTDDPVTSGIEKRLGWLIDPNRKRFAPDAKPDGIPLGNYRGLFSTEYR